MLLEKLTEQVLGGKSAAQAVIKTGEFFTDLLGHSENDYIRQRSIDIEEECEVRSWKRQRVNHHRVNHRKRADIP